MPFPVPLQIAGMGRSLPERIVTSAEVETLCGLQPGWAAAKNGVRERRWAGAEGALQLGVAAAREALERAGLSIDEVDLILNASGTPMQALPDGGPLYQRALGRGSSGIPAFSIHSTCLSFVTALDTCASLLLTGRYRTVLIISSEASTMGLNFNEPESATLIGDAAAAAVVRLAPEGSQSRIVAAHMETYGEGADLAEIRGAGTRKHPTMPETLPEDALFHMDGHRMLRLVSRVVRPFLERLRPGLSSGLGGIRWVVPHQASLIALQSLRSFGWPKEQIASTLEWLGNCVAASIPVTLYDLISRGQVERGDELLLIGSGAGVSLGGMILRY